MLSSIQQRLLFASCVCGGWGGVGGGGGTCFLGKGVQTGAITTLGRGGSDLTATVLGAAMELREVQVGVCSTSSCVGVWS